MGNMTWDLSDLFPMAPNLLVIFLQVICDLRLVGLGCPGQMGGLPKDHIALFSEIKYFEITTRCGRTIAPIRR